MRLLLLGAMMTATLPAFAAPDTPPAAATTVQQDFDAATALFDAGKYAEAVDAWTKLERRVAGRPRSLAVVRLRKGQALFQLARLDEALAATKAGLAALPTGDPTLQNDRWDAYMVLGKVAEAALDYATAAENYRRADDLASTPIDHVAALRGLIETETFVDSDAALADLGRAQPYIADASIDNKSRGSMKRVESQLRLNRGDFAGARKAAGEGVSLLGGLTLKTDLADVAIRSNYAIAAMLLGNRDDARKYMAYTGAGRLSSGTFDPATQMTPPECEGEADLKPDDVAVVEFSIGDDGSVIAATPVYASRGGKAGLAFARAVRNWSWRPDQLKDIPAFFRYRARVEMRCSTEFARPSIATYLDKALATWLATRDVALPTKRDGVDAASLAADRKQLADLEAAKGKDSLALVPTLHRLASNVVISRDDAAEFGKRESAILAANNAPATARLASDMNVWMRAEVATWGGRGYFRTLETFASMAPYASDPESTLILRLAMADLARGFDKQRSLTLLEQVATDPPAKQCGSLRVAALIREAAIYTQRGDAVAAKAAYERTGTSAAQCSLVDSEPRLRTVGGTFPEEAMQWGFEGWVSVQFDIAADGRTSNPRPVIAYPPFIFSTAGSDTMKGAVYEKTYRPDGGTGCGGVTKRVKFLMNR